VSAVDGAVYVCNKTNNSAGVVGNWFNEPLTETFEKRDNALSNKANGEACATCVFWQVCMGGCPNDRDKDGYALDCYLKHYTYFALQGKGVYFLDAFYGKRDK
jgi:radical SAM protein with 4Fe4S-binding SPASM domain